MRTGPLVIAAIILPSLAATAAAQSQFESSKLSPGVVVEGSGLESSKLSSGIVMDNLSLQSPKLSVGIVVQSLAAFKSSKLSVGIVVESVSGSGGVVLRAPLTHW